VNANSPVGRQYALHTGNTPTNWRFTVGSPTAATTEYYSEAEGSCIPGSWKHIAGVYASPGTPALDSVRIYVDGRLAGTNGTGSVVNMGQASTPYIGRLHNADRYMNGLLDHITVSAVRRDSNWIKLSYESQKVMQAFTNIGVTAPSVPGAPTGLVAVNVAPAGSGSVTLSWTAPSNNGGAAITSYTVTGNPGGTCTVTGTTCTITGLNKGVAYSFTVVATNSAGNSAQSNTANITTTGIAIPTAFAIRMDGTNPYTYRLPASSILLTDKLTMTISDIQGKRVWSHTINPSESKVGEITWDGRTSRGSAAGPGMYIVRLRVEMAGEVHESMTKGVKH
jgi:flagellar hook assembly protein FlgD